MSANCKFSQTNRLINYLNNHPKGITQIEALQELGILRLASRISEIKSMRMPIRSEFVEVRNRFNEVCRVKRYWLGEIENEA